MLVKNKKAMIYALLALVTCVPWNATAVNRFSLANLLPKATFSQVSDKASHLAEELLVKSLLEISQGKNQQALETINQVIRDTPNFKLAHLVRGDLLTAQGKYLQGFGGAAENQSENIKDLREEAKVRIERYLSKQYAEKQPDLLLVANPQQNYIIVVDADKSRLYLYKTEDEKLTYQADYYVTIGKNGIVKQAEGDKRTPIGVYLAKGKLSQPLPDLYGDGAYPLNYPNAWDRENNRKGSGIWIHGTPSSTYSRPPRASDGCIVLTNQDLKALAPILQAGNTPVIVAHGLQWLDTPERIQSQKQTLTSAIDAWLNDWRSQDTAQYLSHYSKDFSSNGINFQQWADHKFRVQANKPEVTISLSDMSMFSYPDSQRKMVVVDFVQDFNSPVLKNKMQKRQYWVLENNVWKIIYEGAA